MLKIGAYEFAVGAIIQENMAAMQRGVKAAAEDNAISDGLMV